MKKIITLIVAVGLISTASFAQGRRQSNDNRRSDNSYQTPTRGSNDRSYGNSSTSTWNQGGSRDEHSYSRDRDEHGYSRDRDDKGHYDNDRYRGDRDRDDRRMDRGRENYRSRGRLSFGISFGSGRR